MNRKAMLLDLKLLDLNFDNPNAPIFRERLGEKVSEVSNKAAKLSNKAAEFENPHKKEPTNTSKRNNRL